MRHNGKKRSASSESALAMLLLAVIAMPVLAIVLLGSKNEDDRDWGIFFATASVLIWVPVVFSTIMG